MLSTCVVIIIISPRPPRRSYVYRVYYTHYNILYVLHLYGIDARYNKYNDMCIYIYYVLNVLDAPSRLGPSAGDLTIILCWSGDLGRRRSIAVSVLVISLFSGIDSLRTPLGYVWRRIDDGGSRRYRRARYSDFTHRGYEYCLNF